MSGYRDLICRPHPHPVCARRPDRHVRGLRWKTINSRLCRKSTTASSRLPRVTQADLVAVPRLCLDAETRSLAAPWPDLTRRSFVRWLHTGLSRQEPPTGPKGSQRAISDSLVPTVAATLSSFASTRRFAQRRHLCLARLRLPPHTVATPPASSCARCPPRIPRGVVWWVARFFVHTNVKGLPPAFRLVRQVEPVLVDDAVQVFAQRPCAADSGPRGQRGSAQNARSLTAVFARTGDVGSHRPIPRRFGRHRAALEQEVRRVAPQCDVGLRFLQSCLAPQPF